jgi:hypothetical protein
VIASGVGFILALSVRAALIIRRHTVVVVLTLFWVKETPIRLAFDLRVHLLAVELPIKRVTRFAFKLNVLPEHQRCLGGLCDYGRLCDEARGTTVCGVAWQTCVLSLLLEEVLTGTS